MSEGNQTQHKEGLMDKILHHHHHHQDEGSQQQQQQQQQPSEQQASSQSGVAKAENKESRLQKFEDYIKEDEKMEQQGGTYGGLM